MATLFSLPRSFLLGEGISALRRSGCGQRWVSARRGNFLNRSPESSYEFQARFFASRISECSSGGEIPVEKSVKRKTVRKQKQERSVRTNGLRLSTDEVASGPGAEVDLSRDCGSLHVITGPMFAGKSTALLRRVQEEANRGRRAVLVKSDKDSRYGLSAVVTHDGLQMPCYAVPDLATFRSKVGDTFYKEVDVIGIDEAQFFPDLYEFCLSAADFDMKTVIVAGLDGDFLRRRFGSTLDLIPVADSVVKLSSRCEICGRPAIFSFRKTLDIQTELVGGSNLYMPVCRKHFVSGQIAVDTTSSLINVHEVV